MKYKQLEQVPERTTQFLPNTPDLYIYSLSAHSSLNDRNSSDFRDETNPFSRCVMKYKRENAKETSICKYWKAERERRVNI